MVHGVRPAVGDRLFDGVNLILHFKLGNVFLDLGGDHVGIEAHGGDVEAVAVLQLGGIGFH